MFPLHHDVLQALEKRTTPCLPEQLLPLITKTRHTSRVLGALFALRTKNKAVLLSEGWVPHAWMEDKAARALQKKESMIVSRKVEQSTLAIMPEKHHA